MGEPIISALIGAIVGGTLSAYASYYATKKSHENNLKILQKEEDKEYQTLLKALNTEIQIHWDNHLTQIQKIYDETPEDQPLNIWATKNNQNIFTVFDNNVSKIGLIKNDLLREGIIKGYALAKHQNNAAVHYYELRREHDQNLKRRDLLIAEQNTNLKAINSLSLILDNDYKDLVFYSNQLKKLNALLRKIVEDTLKLLEREIK